MKKKAIFTIVACSIAALLLTGVLVVGLTNGGFGLDVLREEAENGFSQIEGGSRYEYTWDPAETEVTGLDVEWINGTVEVKVGSGNLIRITERSEGVLKEDRKLKLSSSDGTLKIKWGKEFILFSIFENKRKDLVVEAPKAVAEQLAELKCANTSGTITVSGFTAEDMEFSSTSGNLELSALSGGELEASTTSGDVELENVTLSGELSASTASGSMSFDRVKAEEADLNTVSGAVAYVGELSRLNASSVSAAVRVELAGCPKEADLNSVSGDLTLTIPENKGFEAEYSSVSGSFSSDFPVNGGAAKSDRALYGSGEASFSFSTTSGNMYVRKK